MNAPESSDSSNSDLIMQLSPASVAADREVRRDSPFRRARTCYDHLAGVAGVELMDTLHQNGWLEEQGQSKSRTLYRLTPMGEQSLAVRGVELSLVHGSKRIYAYGCTDWTERRFHLGGALGAAILRSLVEAGIVRRDYGTRAVGRLKPLQQWIDNMA